MSPRMRKADPLVAREIVSVVDLSPIRIPNGSGDDFRFRVEVLREAGRRAAFTAKVWRLEYYRVQPTFPQKGQVPDSDAADEQILVVDENFGSEVRARTRTAVLAKVVRMIEARFYPKQRSAAKRRVRG